MEDGTLIFFGNKIDGKVANLDGRRQLYVSDKDRRKAKSVAIGTDHCIILLQDGTLLFAKLLQDGDPVFIEDDGVCGLIIPDLDERKASAVACGANHSVILFEDGETVYYGDNQFGQYDGPYLDDRKVIAVACGANHSGILLENGTP